MAALVVVDVSSGFQDEEAGARLDIFPGSATPAVFQAGAPFWVGYGFAPDSAAAEGAGRIDEGTRFELDVDGRPIPLRTDVRRAGDVVERKTEHADFGEGLSTGWHSFHGRWYDQGRLLLSNRVSIEFVER